jgi:hypothetical protein
MRIFLCMKTCNFEWKEVLLVRHCWLLVHKSGNVRSTSHWFSYLETREANRKVQMKLNACILPLLQLLIETSFVPINIQPVAL